MSDPVSATRTKAADLFRFMSKDQLDTTAKVAALTGITFEAAAALQLCRETLRDYCPPDETYKVVAALVGLESRKAAERNGERP